MVGKGVRRIGESAHLHRRTDIESLDTFRDPFTLRVALGTAVDKTSDEPGHNSVLSGGAAQRQDSARPAGLGCALPAQRHLARRSDRGEANPGSGAIRLQLAFRHGNGLFLGRCRVRVAARKEPAAINENLLENAGANAPRHGCDLIHAGAGVRDALLGAGCSTGPGVHAYGVALPFFRYFPGVARSCAYRQRYFVERPFWQPATNYFSTTRHRPDLDVPG